MAPSRGRAPTQQLLALALALVALRCSGASTTTIVTPPLLMSNVTSITVPLSDGSLVINNTGWLRSLSAGTAYQFVVQPRLAGVEVAYNETYSTQLVQNAGCLFYSVGSNFATVSAFLSAFAGLAPIPDASQGRVDWARTYRVPGTSAYNMRASSRLVALNSSGLYTVAATNSGGQSRSHPDENTRSNTTLQYRLGAYAPGSEACKGASVVGDGPLTTSGWRGTLALADVKSVGSRRARMVTAFANASCVAFQLLSLPPLSHANGTASLPAAEVQRDMSAFLTSAAAAELWTRGSLAGAPAVLGGVCRQLSAPGNDSSANATATFGFDTAAAGVAAAAPNSTVTQRQSCQVAVDGLDPTQIYVLWAVNNWQLNGLALEGVTPGASNVKWTARSTGSCAALQFSPASDYGQPLPADALQAQAAVGQPPAPPLQLAPLGAPAPAPGLMAVEAESLPLTQDGPAPAAAPFAGGAPSPRAEGPLPSARLVNLIPSPPPPPAAPPPPPPLLSATPSPTSGQGQASRGGYWLSGGAIAGIVVGAVAGMAASGAAGYALGRRRAALAPAAAGGKGGSWGSQEHGSRPPSGGDAALGFLGGLKSWVASSEEPPNAFGAGPPGGGGGSPGSSSGCDSQEAPPAPSARSRASQAAPPTPSATAPQQPLASPRQSAETGSGSGGGSLDDGWRIPGEEIEYVTASGEPVLLGSGSFGQVFRAKLGRVQDVAVKQLRRELDPVEAARLQQHLFGEIALLRRCRQRNIVTFQGISHKGGHVLLVMEMLQTDLRAALAAPGSAFTWAGGRGAGVLLGIAQGLAYLHWRSVIHFDLKSANVLLTADGEAKITDVGLSQVLAPGRTHLSQQQGFTLPWAAPEVLMGWKCTAAADMYSFGVVLWEVVTAGAPRRGQLRPPRVPEECGPEVVALWQRCMREDPQLRPTAAEAARLLEQMA